MNLSIPLGIEDFAEMRENGYYYVDKTSFIKELLNQKSKANLVPRPRRFGKTLTMSMLEDFFDISRDSMVHFKDLLIYKDIELCRELMNKWPVIFISLKDAEGLNFEITLPQSHRLKPVGLQQRYFKKSVKDWFDNVVRTADRSVIFNSLWSGDARTAEEEISNLLFMTISYNDYKESFYHAFIAGLFAGAGYIVESNHEYGEGRPDVVINEKRKRRAMLFEIKCAGDDETLEHACSKAVAQIHDRKYDEPFKLEGYCNVVSYGIAFKKKNCMIKKYNDSDGNLPLKDMNVFN